MRQRRHLCMNEAGGSVYVRLPIFTILIFFFGISFEYRCVVWCTHEWRSRGTHVNESCHTYEWVTGHMCTSCHTFEYFMSYIWTSHGTCARVKAPWFEIVMRRWVMSHTWMSHVTHINASCHTHNESCLTYEWVMSHTFKHVTHMNESCHTHEWVMSHT